jgi:predicted small secreted protein
VHFFLWRSLVLANHAPERRFAALFLVLLMLGLAACNTIEGAGQDLEAAGEGIADTAEDAAD